MVDHLQTPALTGSRCSLRGWRLADAEALEAACGDPDICRLTTVPSEYGRDAAQRWIGRQHDHLVNGTASVLAIVAVAEGPPVGMAGLFGLDGGDRTARFGYWLTAKHRGQGLAGNATRLLAEWAFSDLDLVAIYINREPGNAASARIGVSLGARETGSWSVVLAGEQVTLIRHKFTRPVATSRAPH